MKELIMKIPREMLRIVSNLFSFILLSIYISGCASLKKDREKIEEDLYAIIEKESYSPNSLYYKTIPYEELIAKESFTYQNLRENNYHKSILVEEERYIDFDTVFSPEKRREITAHFQSLEEVELNKSQMKHPEVLSRITRSIIGEPSKSRGTNRITFPFIVEGKKGELYGFIYRSSVGNLYVYGKTKGKWEKVAVVHILID